MLQYTFMQHALLASLFIAVLSPIIGLFLVLRRHAMIGDALSHSSLAGVTLGLLFGRNPVLSAFVFTALSGLLIEYLRDAFRRYTELILSIVLALGVGIAITLISSDKIQANADAFLFGSILTVSRQDLYAVIGLTVISFIVLALLFHRLVAVTYDAEAARVAGINVRLTNYLFILLVAAVIAMMIRIVGVMVVSSLLTLPVAAAMQFRTGFRRTLGLAVIFSLAEMLGGLTLSYHVNVAPGGFTILLSVGVLLFVMIGRRLWYAVRSRRTRIRGDEPAKEV